MISSTNLKLENTSVAQYCLMGNPVNHSHSPWIHSRFASLTGQNLCYKLQHVELDSFEQELRRFICNGGKGCNVTVPFKFAAIKFAHNLSNRAKLAGAANTLHIINDEIYADNTDGLGLVLDIVQHANVELRGSKILLMGAGGAAAGVLGALIQSKPAQITLASRRMQPALDLLQNHKTIAKLSSCSLRVDILNKIGTRKSEDFFDVIINATSSSLHASEIVISDNIFRPNTFVLDMMYGMKSKKFLNYARQNGAIVRDGLGMLVSQAFYAFKLWRTVAPKASQLRQVLKELRYIIDTSKNL